MTGVRRAAAADAGRRALTSYLNYYTTHPKKRKFSPGMRQKSGEALLRRAGF